MRRYKSCFIILKQDKLGYSFRNREPQGRLSIETFGDVSKVMLTIQDLKPETIYKAYLIKADDTGKSIGVSMGNLFPNQQGKCELRQQYNSSNVLNSDISIDDFNVVAVTLAEDGEFSSPLVGYKRDAIRWKNNFSEFHDNYVKEAKEAIKVEENSEPAMPPIEMPPIEPPLVEPPPAEIPEENPPNEIPEQTPNEIPEQIPNEIGTPFEANDGLGELPNEEPPVDIRAKFLSEIPFNKEREEDKEKEPEKEPEKQLLKKEEPKKKKEPKKKLEEKPHEIPPEKEQEKQIPAQRLEAESKREPQKEDLHEVFKAMATRLNREMLELEKFAFSINNKPMKEQGAEPAQPTQSAQSTQAVQSIDDISILFKTKVKVSPFKQRRKNITWIKICLKELCYVNIDHFLYMNDPLIANSIKKYSHLILGEIKDESKTSYILGVPDCYNQEYDSVALKLGFSQFKCCSEAQTAKGEYGYWLMPVS